MESVASIEIDLDFIHEDLCLWVDARRIDSLYDAKETAADHNEARYQLVEGCLYDYKLSDDTFLLGSIGENIISRHRRDTNIGTISPNIFVGTLEIPVLHRDTYEECGKIFLEVQSVKSDYRDDYRVMLEFITNKCTDLLLRVDSPVTQQFAIDFTRDSKTLYQRFSFIRSIVATVEFDESIHRILNGPVTRWSDTTERSDIRNIRRFSNANIRELLKNNKRNETPQNLFLREYGIRTLPEKITTTRKTDSVDTPENRFVKHALENFLKFCIDINSKAVEFAHEKMVRESKILIHKIESYLQHSIFKEISRPSTLKLNSPVLQRKEGYRGILRVWLMFDLASKLIWSGGDSIYSGGKKDIATLYEYWLFFQLLDLFQTIFDIDQKDIDELIKETSDGLSLQLRQGKFTALQGIYNAGSRLLNVRFNYNRTFSGRSEYPEPGSWTTTLRPDYTLSLWPVGITESEAERQELIVHIHFDAKYRVANLTEFIVENDEKELDEEKVENSKGVYKNADLLKMHAYKDAIRRTGGAYVLYPGDKTTKQKGFHEIIPGLGAFSVKPSTSNSGIGELKEFIHEIIAHFINRASQREKIAYRTYDTYKSPPNDDDVVNELLPEPYNYNRDLIPDDTFVLIGYYNSKEQYDWVKQNSLYNFRMGSGRGSLILDKETVSAKYLLLHTKMDTISGELWKIVSRGPRVYSNQDLINKGYPNPSKANYLVIKIEPVDDPEFKSVQWNFRKLANYSSGRSSAFPFTASLSELMRNKVYVKK